MARRSSLGAVPLLVGAAAACALALAWRWPLLAAVAAAASSPALALFAVRAWQHQRLAAALRHTSQPGRVEGVALRWRSFAARAAVAGLWRPTVFCDPRLRHELEPDELRAVVLHERAHQVERDPLRLLALAAVAPLAGLLPQGRTWLARQRAAIEIDADRFALTHGASRSRLASALLKLGTPQHAPSLAGYTCASELRLRWLVDGDQVAVRPLIHRPRLVAGSVVALVVGVCAAAWVHHSMTTAGGLACIWPGC